MARLALTGADLVVVGKSRRHAAVDWLLGSTAHDLLVQSPCDVMVVPDDFPVSAVGSPVPHFRQLPVRKQAAWPAHWSQ